MMALARRPTRILGILTRDRAENLMIRESYNPIVTVFEDILGAVSDDDDGTPSYILHSGYEI